MPSIADYDKSDEDSGGADDGYTPGQANAIGSATGGPQQAPTQKQQQDEFTPWSSFVSANQDVSNREAGKLAGQVQGDVTKAQGDLSSAQSGFDSGIASNYNQPATSSGATTPTPKKTTTANGAQQNTPQNGTAYDSGLQQAPNSAAAQRTPVSNTPEPSGNRIPLNGGNSKIGQQTPQQRQPVAQQQAPQALSQATTTPAAQRAAQGAASLPVAPTPTVAALTPSQNPGAQTLLGATRAHNLGANAAANGAQGPQDLEHAAGEQAWSSLVSDTNKAGSEANALGSEAGVQGLLQQNQSSPGNSAFDAALINGQGGPQFRALANKYGKGQLEQNAVNAEKGSQDAWNQLRGDVSERQAFDKAGQAAGGSAGQLSTADMTAKTSADANDPTNPSSSAYWDAPAANGNSNLQNLRSDNAAGYNAVSGELGFDDGGAGRVDGHDWVSNVLQNLPANPAPGSYQANIKQAVDGAEQGLGISQEALYGDLSRMNNTELSDFWALGVIPQWMDVSGGYGKGIVGGWQSPYIQPTIAYGNDGGMWSAVENLWKTGASDVGGAIPFVGPLIKAGLDQVKIGDSRKDKFHK